MEILGDYHTHTFYSDGKKSMEEMVKGALLKGLKELAITDHGPANRLAKGKEGDFLIYQEELKALQRKYPKIRLLIGVEANIVSQDGDLDLSLDILEEMDIILAGLHLNIGRFRGFGPFYPLRNIVHSYLSSSLFQAIEEQNTRSIVLALTRYPIHILTHPGLHMHINTHEVAEVAAREGTMMELNARHPGVSLEYLQIVASKGALLVVNSDAHHSREVGEVSSLYPLIRASNLPSTAFYNLQW